MNYSKQKERSEIMKIKILSQEYEVIEEKVIDRDGNLLGQVNLITNEISICSDMPKEKKEITLLHEILHAILQQLAFHEECDNENLISGLSTGIYQVLRDNKNLFTF